jgi:TPR repeat protein
VLDEETAVKWRQLAAEGDDVEGRHRLGQLYEEGELGLEPDEEGRSSGKARQRTAAARRYRLGSEISSTETYLRAL